ncbi:BID domain-containing protein, partial [Rhizobium laguerreae]
KDQSVAQSTLAKVAGAPESFGALKGKTGVLASRADRQDREKAIANVPALARNLERYLRERAEAEFKHEKEERAVRLKVSVDIPALSPAAKQTLERVRDAIDRNDLPAGLEYALADKMVKAELEGFAKAVAERFGERTFLPLAAKDTSGKTFEAVTSGMTAGQKAEVQSAWNSMRTVQQLAAYERTMEALKQAEMLRQTKSQGLSLK